MNLKNMVDFLNGIIWSKALIYLCLGIGVYFSIVTRVLQVRHIKEMIKLMFKGSSSEKGISSFQALAISISGRVGTGNIAGVATAIALGGPGALFWMWSIAFLGASSAFVESALGQIYKVEKDGQYRGGPSYYIEKGLGIKWYAVLFSIATIVGAGVFLPGVQSNSIASAFKGAFGIPPTVSGIFIVVLLAIIVFGGVKRIGKVAEVIVPFMAIAYIIMAVIILIMNIREIPRVFTLIITSAFGANQIFGGILGMAISWGVKRGIYSNEAGQGTGPHAASAAEVSHPAQQGLVQAFSVYIDTLFVCSATGFMILITGNYNTYDPAGGFLVENLAGVEIGPAYTMAAVDSVFPGIGTIFIAVALFFFAFTTIMAYYYIGETNVAYIEKEGDTKYITIFRVLFLIATYFGAVRTASLAWAIGDIGVGMMAWLNIIAIILLRKPALICLKDYEEQVSQGIENPVFHPEKLKIEGANFWEKRIAKKNAVKK
ncbi:alanine/glycine:cation symporter family protein [uncultured Ilyobacter sp.]|uniref:alanine/glycine:cation symporter family protein n=1 Tax=uncultured Ilyobacter sp. TaxID=544433 RepID=UPI0029F53B97|nr:alanine/glycine:cation symporter family protein [uncultured Ilyobacter sp.]